MTRPESRSQRAIRDKMDRYVRKHAPDIPGWLANESAQVISHLAMTQIQGGITGGVGEIGIHHGKLFLLLYLSLQEGERAFALDVFEEQQLNVDGSGRGDRSAFLRNFVRIGGDRERLTVFAMDSCSVSADDLRTKTGPLRLMSIDGGHTEDITHNDMGLAEDLLLDEGILVLDDVYSERWPAVAAGAFRFVLEPGRRLRPFAISPNKTYFCKSPDAAAHYRKALGANCRELRVSRATVFGSEVLILGKRTFVNRIRNHPVVENNPRLYQSLSRVRAMMRPSGRSSTR
ncbi:class I SAM-dependent methyltransferase [Mycolicibacterium pulveris]|uniref:class I SAM-dependent methyltransferase n=1 Tax=Mycolicibacterium pulveris TaxID=36813 RepID=UPI003CF00971